MFPTPIRIKTLIAGVLAAALVFLAPGLAPYQALAVTINAGASARGGVSGQNGAGIRVLQVAPLLVSPQTGGTGLLVPSLAAPAEGPRIDGAQTVPAAADSSAVEISKAVAAKPARNIILPDLTQRQTEVLETLGHDDVSNEDTSKAAAVLFDKTPARPSADADVSAPGETGKSLIGKSLPGKPLAGKDLASRRKQARPLIPKVGDLQYLVQPEKAKGPDSFWAKLWAGLKQIPPPFYHFVWGSSLLTVASEGTSIITSIYGISQFGAIAGVLSQAVGLVFRIPGSLIGARVVKKFDAKKMYIFTTALRGLLLLSLPLGSWLWGTAALSVLGLFSVNAFLLHYLAFQALDGLIYGATRGMAESQIMPRLVGQDPKVLETSGFLWMAAIETFALGTAFFLSPWVRGAFGPNVAIAVFGAIMLSSLFFFKKIKFLDEPQTAAAPKKEETPKNDEGKLDKLPMKEYIPYIMASFLHFVFYSLFSGVFATYTFKMDKMADWSTGFYDTGSLAIGLLAAIPALLATLDPKTGGAEDPGKKKGGVIAWFNNIPLKYWFALAIGGGIFYLGAGLAAIKIAGLIAAAALGALTTVNRTKWMSSYLSRLKTEHHGKVIARLNSASTVAALVPFAIFSVGQLLGAAIAPLLLGISAVIAAGMIIAWLLKRK